MKYIRLNFREFYNLSCIVLFTPFLWMLLYNTGNGLRAD